MTSITSDSNQLQVRLKELHQVLLSYKKVYIIKLTSTFAKGKGQFINLKDQRSAEKKVLYSHLKDHSFRLRKLLDDHSASTEALRQILNNKFFKIICFKVLVVLWQKNAKQLICKNKKLHDLKIKFKG